MNEINEKDLVDLESAAFRKLILHLKENPEIAKEIEQKILENAGIVEKAMMEGNTRSSKEE